ncbi:fasciclin domain-containing protein [Acuticoccus kandeliae]|uniref:fasciclin domain-containing protein n=1 Tax=Acuticoccus kandeliae TaxID=2073160 RepID=UPI000D3EB613|nr:fasciclin domain-containing protein [Acuticoccus kandeliae]
MNFAPNYRLFEGSDQSEKLNGSKFPDIIIGYAGNDRIFAGADADIVYGQEGGDRIGGGGGNDFLSGGDGFDQLFGGRGHDNILGGRGFDWLEGGIGDDALSGGQGTDRFYFDPNRLGEGRDIVRDLELKLDKIVLDVDSVLASSPDLAELIIANGGDAAATFAALDESAFWDLGSAGNNLEIFHPTGSIVLKGIPASAVSGFGDLSGAIAVEGLGEVLTGLPVDGRPESIAAVVAPSGGTPDDDNSDFDLLLTALNFTGLTDVLADPDARFSVLAPTDAAFISLAQRLGYGGDDEAGSLDFILDTLTVLGGGDPAPLLTDVLTYHVVGGAMTLGELQSERVVTPLYGDEDLTFLGNRIGDADPDFSNPRVLAADIQTDNGIIQVIDEVLLPFNV